MDRETLKELKKARFFLQNMSDAKPDLKEAFSNIYKNAVWGGEKGKYYSGGGSHDPEIIEPYILFLTDFIRTREIRSVCDVGAGDFFIMNRVMSACPDIEYYGLDIVDDLIHYNSETFGNDYIHFISADASDPETVLPAADLLIVRQVLQHLSNKNIQTILGKSKSFRYVLITEDIYAGDDVEYNIDKIDGSGTRTDACSGVYIEYAPFQIQPVEHVLNISNPEDTDRVIRTTLIENKADR